MSSIAEQLRDSIIFVAQEKNSQIDEVIRGMQ